MPHITDGNSSYSLVGAKYYLYTDEACTNHLWTFTIKEAKDKDGNTIYDSNVATLPLGTYYIKEITAPPGYKVDTTTYTATISSKHETTPLVLDVKDEPYTGYFRIHKVSTDPTLTNNNSNYSLDGTTYAVYKDETCTIPAVQVSLLQTTKAPLLATIGEKGYSATYQLPFGTYYLKETKSGPGFKVDTKVHSFTLTKDHNTEDLRLEKELKDELYKALMQVIKASSNPSLTNNNSNYSLAGAKFGVYNDVSCTTLLKTLVTDANGKTEYYALPLGTYYVKETEAPKGFAISDEVKKVVLSAGHDTEDTAVLTTITDDPYKMVTIRLGKRDGQYATKLEGAEFTVYAWDGRSYSKVVGKMDDLGLGQYAFSFYHKDGVDGKYQVVETKNPEGYTGPWSQEFVVDETSSQEQAFSYDAVNYQEQKYFKIEVTKTDSVTGAALSGCEFTVYEYSPITQKYVKLGTLVWDAESKKYVSELNEDLKEKLRTSYVEGGNQGKFRIVETKVPDGYVQSTPFRQDFEVLESSLDG